MEKKIKPTNGNSDEPSHEGSFAKRTDAIIRRMAKYKETGIISELNLTALIKFSQIKKKAALKNSELLQRFREVGTHPEREKSVLLEIFWCLFMWLSFLLNHNPYCKDRA